MTAAWVALGVGVLLGLVVALFLGAWLGRTTKPTVATPLTDAAVTEAQRVIADSFTRFREVAEGQRAAMLAAGWSDELAAMCAAQTYMSLVAGTCLTRTGSNT